MFSVKGKWKDNIMVEYFYDENEDIWLFDCFFD